MKWTFLLYVALCNIALADDNYKCVIDRVEQSHTDSGSSVNLYRNSYIGKVFNVERNSGLMVGALNNSYITIPQIIDKGSKSNSYKVITTLKLDEGTGNGSNLYALIIDEFVKSQNKPFTFLQNNMVYFGNCEHVSNS